MGNEAEPKSDSSNLNVRSGADGPTPEPVTREPTRTGAVAESPVSVEAFTSGRDVACPRCQYNLRGAAGPNCPECGLRLEVGLVAARRGVLSSGVVLAVLLALSWVVVATGMNTARSARMVVELARAAAVSAAMPRIVFSSASSFSVRSSLGGSINVGRGGQSSVTQFNPDGSSTMTVTKTDGSQTVTTTLANGTVINGPAPVGAGGGSGAPAYVWAAVAPAEWSKLWWWGSLSVMSLVGLLVSCVLLMRCGGEWGSRWTKVMTGWAGVVFACYGGYHVVTFARDVATW